MCRPLGHLYQTGYVDLASVLTRYLNPPHAHIQETGVGGTSAWRVSGIDPATSLCVMFEVVNQQASAIPQGQPGAVQFITFYQHASGQKRVRVTTVARQWVWRWFNCWNWAYNRRCTYMYISVLYVYMQVIGYIRDWVHNKCVVV